MKIPLIVTPSGDLYNHELNARSREKESAETLRRYGLPDAQRYLSVYKEDGFSPNYIVTLRQNHITASSRTSQDLTELKEHISRAFDISHLLDKKQGEIQGLDLIVTQEPYAPVIEKVARSRGYKLERIEQITY